MAKKILVIDDEELIIKTLSKLLEKQGYEVFIAKNGQDAIVMADEVRFDLIIADIRMPGMSGTEAAEAIQKNAAAKNEGRIPIIFITGYADELVEKTAKGLNPIAYILKPFDIKELIEKVKDALR
jgi:CheY-like chemotaxis protein